MGMRNKNRRMEYKAAMTFRELENGESVDSGKKGKANSQALSSF